ncbi:MAG: ATP phosphoribosyltransferase [Polyangiaceae bacterium]|nr:ATP phosphoribosyltransferase [Polyangiaceae bacterium]
MPSDTTTTLRLALPKGRMQEGIVRLLGAAGIQLSADDRGYRPRLSLPGCETKLLKPQNAVEMLHLGSRDFGFAGADWVAELGAELVELLDTELDPVRLVAAAPLALLRGGELPRDRRLVVASEYERLTRAWIARRGLDAAFVRSYGATEVFPPEDADCIVDNTSSGATLRANGLEIVDELMRSSTRLYAHPHALEDTGKRRAIEDLVLLVRSVLEARKRVMLEVNVSAADFAAVIAVLPCMRQPTVSELAGSGGFAVKAAVPRARLPELVPLLKSKGATDIIVSRLDQIVP